MEHKRGEGKQRFQKWGQAGSRGGCLKKEREGCWNPLPNYEKILRIWNAL